MDNIIVKLITHGSKEYEAALLLRDEILRKPIGLNINDEDLSGEENDIHIGAFDGEALVGILVLTKIDEGEIQMRQVAVALPYQGTGIGKHLVNFCEQTCKDEGYKCIRLHARITAVEFYKYMEYTVVGDMFKEVGIPHLEMEKYL
ncbi:MAG: GNAT family N-acetyltransferase [Clostridia bacterium]|nr:GNAT family N-acetyltransferase [Clostridia bacterium]